MIGTRLVKPFSRSLSILLLISSPLAFSEPPNFALHYQQVKRYHDSGAYQREFRERIDCALQYIKQRVLRNQHSPHPQKLALVLDIDETSISNYHLMEPRNYLSTRQQLKADALAASSPAIPTTLALYRYALQHNVAVFFVTGRPVAEEAITRKNLLKAGFTKWTGLYFKPNDYHNTSSIPYKSQARANITHNGYTIIANIGDQWSDLKGGFAETWYKLPNPYYFIP